MSLKDEYVFKKEISAAANDMFVEYLSICRDLTDEDKRVVIVLFLQEALAECNTEPAIIGGGGKFGEILAAHKRGCVMNSKMTGVDMVNKETGEAQEQKTSNGGINKKTNFNFAYPKCPDTTTGAEYRKLIRSTTLAKGDVYLSHVLSPKESYEYTLSKEFMAELLVYKWTNNQNSFHVNLGAMPCKKCRHVHRMLYLMSLDGEWSKLSNKDTFDWSRTEHKIPSNQQCVTFLDPVFKEANNNNNNKPINKK
jgi:hypothetical protein